MQHMRHGKRAVSISAVGAGNAAWTRHAHGVTRRTPYGHETITLAANAAEVRGMAGEDGTGFNAGSGPRGHRAPSTRASCDGSAGGGT